MNSKSLKEENRVKYIANFDYEQCLARRTHYSLDIVKQWDWTVLWIEGCSYNLDWYSKEYLSFVNEFRSIQSLPSNCEKVFWWGKFKNIEKEREFNSKLMALQCKNELNINFLSEEVFSQKKEYLGHHYLRDNLGFAGKGSQIFAHKPKNINQLKTYLVAPYITKKIDFSTWSNGEDHFIYKNIVSRNGQYIGTKIDESDFQKSILKKTNEMDDRIRQWYIEQGADNTFGIDYFLYQDQVIFCEVNYRKTMGYIANKLKNIIAPRAKEFYFSTQPSMKVQSKLISSPYCPIKWYVSHS